MKRSLLLTAALAAALLTGGCARRVIFTTHSSLGLDVSGTAQYPNKVSFSYNRYEGAIVPMMTNGAAHSVYGGMDADMTWFNGHAISQTFATGKAAQYAAGAARASAGKGTNPLPDDATNGKGRTKDYPLVFFTGTTYGLHLTAGESQMSPNLLMGYRRSEAAVIPVTDPGREVRSVYADISIATTTNSDVNVTTNFSALGGVRIKQSFATGAAADKIAKSSLEAKAKLAKAAGFQQRAAALKGNMSKAGALVKDIEKQLDRMDDAQLNKAVDALKQAELIPSAKVATLKGVSDQDKKREAILSYSGAEDCEEDDCLKTAGDFLQTLKSIP